MAVAVTIEVADKTSLVHRMSPSITDELNSRNTFSLEMVDAAGSYRPIVGQDIVIQKDAITIFAGTIDNIEESNPPGTDALAYKIDCVDYNQILDRFLVAEIYENDVAGDIIKDIIDNFVNAEFSGEGITYVNVEDGPTITKAVFNYIPASQALDEIAAITGYYWYIDYSKDLHFQSKLTNNAPFGLTDTSANFRNIVVKRNRNDYRNRQHIRGGKDISLPRTDSFTGDGETQTFTLQLEAAQVPSAITVNSVAKTIGIRQVETGKDWYWNKGEKEITQDDAGVKLTNVDTLAVTYKGYFPINLQNDYDGEILNRQSIEGGTGIYSHVIQDASLDTEDAAVERSEGLLRKYGSIPEIVEFETDTDGLKAGQLIPIVITKHNLNGNYLIQQVTIQDVGASILRYNVTALSGEAIGGWEKFFKQMARAGQQYVINENEVLLKLKKFLDSVTLTDSITVSSAAPESRVGTALVGFSEVA